MQDPIKLIIWACENVKKKAVILIADHNPHIRNLLKREIEQAGFQVELVGNGTEIINRIRRHEPCDLLIIDPDIPEMTRSSVWDKLQALIPPVPIIIHGFDPRENDRLTQFMRIQFIQKDRRSVEKLKGAVCKYFEAIAEI